MDTESAIYLMIGERVAAFRRESSLAQDDLAQRVGCSRVTISNIERGRHRASLGLLHRITEQLGVDLPSLMPTREDVARRFPTGAQAPEARAAQPERAVTVLDSLLASLESDDAQG